MHIGIVSNCTDRSLDPGAQARLVEQAGLESLVFGEHSHIPAARETPYPGGTGALPPGYERTLDLFVALAAAALASTTLKIGSGICQVVQRDPILTAKAVASIDHMSGGRMLLITGSSWNMQEMRNHGTDPDTRYQLLEERVLAMREIWNEDVATFHGDFVNFDRIWSWPKPVQSPMPVFIGGNSEGSEARAQRVGTGWAPLDAPGIAERIRVYLRDAQRLGVETAVTAVAGELDAKRIDDYAQAGAERWLHHIPLELAVTEDVFVSELERLDSVYAEFAGTP
jgi:probable F420-dependent oxidoreductase